jgi:hypothetical protein
MKNKAIFGIKHGWILKIDNLYREAKKLKLSSAEINEKYISIMDEFPKDAPKWLRCYLDGYEYALKRELQRGDLLEFCYVLDNGSIISMDKDSVRFYKCLGVSLDNLGGRKNGFYWVGSDKPYFVSE